MKSRLMVSAVAACACLMVGLTASRAQQAGSGEKKPQEGSGDKKPQEGVTEAGSGVKNMLYVLNRTNDRALEVVAGGHLFVPEGAVYVLSRGRTAVTVSTGRTTRRESVRVGRRGGRPEQRCGE
jgi:hypothetical protein